MLPALPPPSESLPEPHARLYAALAECGWQQRPGALVAPHGTFWLPLAPLDLMRLRNHVAARRDRVFRTRTAYLSHSDFRAAYDDLDTLLGVLEQLSDDGGLDRFFGPLAYPLERLARARGLAVTRYDDGEATWRLRAPHPRTGRITVVVRKVAIDTVEVSACWSYWSRTLDDRVERRREPVRLPRDGTLVAAFVGRAIDELRRDPVEDAPVEAA